LSVRGKPGSGEYQPGAAIVAVEDWFNRQLELPMAAKAFERIDLFLSHSLPFWSDGLLPVKPPRRGKRIGLPDFLPS
jgi:hypothetical protein